MDMQVSYLDRLFDAGILMDMGVDGLYARSGLFEDVVSGIEGMVTKVGRDDGAEVMRFPPGIYMKHFEKSGYMGNFPQLAGTIHSFCGCEADHLNLIQCMQAGEDWTKDQKATDLAYTPAACYPLYPIVANRGELPVSGGVYDIQSYCFRHEPSKDPARQQLFRQREFVWMGKAENVQGFRQTWMERAQAIMTELQLPHEIEVANDPFFGRAGRMMKNTQREQTLKFELVIPITSTSNPTACCSFNYHTDKFGQVFGLKTADGETAHTGCVGFGLERITLALFHHHGLDAKLWPEGVRKALWG